MRTTIAVMVAVIALTGCLATSREKPESFYDYQLLSPNHHALSIHALPKDLIQADVLLIGEWHTHSGIHRFQTDLLKALTKQKPSFALSMEQFTRDSQPTIDAYLAGEIGEQTLILDGNAWPNYASDYRPLIEYAKKQNVEVIAANAPKPIVRCIGKLGLEYLDTLDKKERKFVAAHIDTTDSAYKQRFMASMHHGNLAQTERQYAAQATWDETMAESIVNYLDVNPNKQVIHIAGKFHTQEGLGIKASI